MKKTIYLMAIAAVTMTAVSCKKQYGCTDPTALNYSTEAEADDGSCISESEVNNLFIEEFTVDFGPLTSSMSHATSFIFEPGDLLILEAKADEIGGNEYWMALPYINSDYSILGYYNENNGLIFIDSYDSNTDLAYNWTTTESFKFRACLVKKKMVVANPGIKDMTIEEIKKLK